MPRPVPPQVIPRPADWRLGPASPWAQLPPAALRKISVDRVLAALDARGQRGPVPEAIDGEGVIIPAVPINDVDVSGPHAVNAAVLALLFEEAGEARLVFTRRSTSLRSHRGEVSFPGGRLERGEDAPSAALREAHEEITLDPAMVTVEGWIHPVLTVVTGSLVMPIVATTPSRPQLLASPAEVERVFDVSLRELADPGTFHEEQWHMAGSRDDAPPFSVWFFEVEGEMIWGATARMLHELLRVVLLPVS